MRDVTKSAAELRQEPGESINLLSCLLIREILILQGISRIDCHSVSAPSDSFLLFCPRFW